MIKKTLSIIALSGGIIISGYLFSIDNSTIVDGELVEHNEVDQTETVAIHSNESNVNDSNTISEEFVITYADNDIIRGELVNRQGEGIYYKLNDEDIKEHEAFYNLATNDLIMIEWTTSNYNAGDWTDIKRVLYNGKGNVSDSNRVNVVGVEL